MYDGLKILYDGFDSTQKSMESVIDGFSVSRELEQLKSEDNILRIVSFERAMYSLVGVQIGLSEGSAPSASDLENFRVRVVSLIAGSSHTFFNYLCDVFDYVFAAWEDGWEKPCYCRSAIQLLIDDYPGAAKLVHEDDEIRGMLEEVDDALRERGVEEDPLQEEDIPASLPDSHWWWRLPAGGAVVE
ncbi:hypothetical protein ACL02S_05770 [Nocardia sp. 004]|uniref:hypothetical protein n=1 Tax=Nocardia sp. 004 TaxID=3385978 RepID=UPI0039A26336